MEDVVLMPVRWEHLDEVRAFVERLEAKNIADADDAVESRAALLRKVYESCSEPTKRVLLYLAEHPGKWILGIELAEKAAQQGNRNVSPQLRSLNVAVWRHGLSPSPVELKRRYDRLFVFRMPHEDATIIKGFVD
jgi:hypothetical protein